MHSLCLIVNSHFSSHYEKRININFYKKKGFKIKIFNVSNITYYNYFKNFKYKIKKNQKIITKKNIKSVFSKLKNFDTIMVMLTLDEKSKIIFDELNKNNINYSLLESATLPTFPIFNKNFSEILFILSRYPLKAIAKAIRFINRPKVKISPKYIFYPGSRLYERWKKYSSASKLISIPAMDYDRLIIYKRNKKRQKNIKKNKFATYIADYHFHPDTVFREESIIPQKHPSTDLYYKPIKSFLEDFNKITNLEINIAKHPKQENKINYYNYGKQFSAKTFELVRDSNFVIVQSSLAVSFAVLFSKPMIFISNSYFSYATKKAVSIQATYFEKKPFDVAREKFDLKRFKYEKKINYQKYENYIKEYLLHKKETRTSYEIISEIIKNR